MSNNFSRRRALTWIICTVVVVLGLPAGAFAVVAGSNVFLTDPSTGHRAHVNGSGQVLTNDSGSTVKVGNTVSVTGTVRSNLYPAKPFTLSCFGSHTDSGGAMGVGCSKAVPTGETFVVQHFSAHCDVNTNDTASPSTVEVMSHDTTGTEQSWFMTSGPAAHFGSEGATDAELNGTEYMTGLVEIACDTPYALGYSEQLYATAQGYLYP